MAGTGIIHYLQTSDAITHGVPYVLLAMSIVSWCFLIVKSWILTRAKHQASRAIARFWQAATLSDGVIALKQVDRERVFTPLAEAALHAAEVDIPGALLARVERSERVLRALRQALNTSQRRLESARCCCWRRWAARRRSSGCSALCGASITRSAASPRAVRR